MNKLLFIFTLLFSIALSSHAQNVIKGKVIDATNGEPIIGASVIISGTKTGTVTDTEGRFQLSIKDGQKLRVSYLGKKTCECMAHDNIKIELEDDSRNINDVVVVAYGTRQRHDLTGSIASINSASITENPVTSLEQAMEGKLPGVQVTQGGGMPGGAVSVNIRGTSSISAGNEPLYVVDGFPILSQDLSQSGGFQGNPISGIADIDPNDIQSIEVLKDASASALYGSRASNGVVLITTKKGKAGKTKVTLDSYVGFQDIPHMISKLGAQELTDAYNEARSNYNSSLSLSSDDATYLQPVSRHDTSADTDWFSELTRKALQTSHQLAVSGGNDRTQFYLSGGYMQQDGVIKNVTYKRYNLRSNISHKLNSHIRIDGNIALSYAYDRRSTGDGNIYSPWVNALNAPSDYPVFNSDGSYASLPGSLYNPLNLIEGQEQENKKYRAIINLKGTFNILPGLDYTLSLNGDYNIMHEYGYFPSTSIQGQGDNGDVSDYRGFSFSQLMEHNLTYSHSWKGVDMTALAGYSYQKTSLDNANVEGINFLSPSLKYLNSAGSITGGSSSLDEYALSSFYGRLDFKILSRYLLEVSLRADRSSKFAPSKRTGWFPAASVGWHASEERWFPKNKFISDLKFRASIGKTGNQEGIGDYEWQTVYESGSDYNNDPGLTIPSTQSNPNLTWEKTTQYDAGFDASLFSHRIDLTFDWNRKNTHDLLLNHSVNALTGYSDRTDNVGSLYNTGIELAITSHNIDSDFKWDTNLAFSWTKNKITSLYNDDDIETGSHNILRVGESMASFYLIRMDGIYQSKEEILSQKNGQQLWDLLRAANLAEEVIADGNFELADDAAEIWQTKTSKEMIFATVNPSTDAWCPGWFLRSNLVDKMQKAGMDTGYGAQGRYMFPVDNSLMNAFEEGDNRKAATVRTLTYGTKTTRDLVKYPGPNGTDSYPIVRIAEMYLIAAEAEGRENGLKWLNALRASRGLKALSAADIADDDAYEARIMQERRVEFVGEGLRWYDLRRWFNRDAAGKEAVLKLRCYQANETAGSRPTASDAMNISEDGHELLWPIPTVARDNDSALTQNDGY